jgi:hypothetical protein
MAFLVENAKQPNKSLSLRYEMSDIGHIQLYLGMCIFEIAPESALKLIRLGTSVLNLIASAGECQSTFYTASDRCQHAPYQKYCKCNTGRY